MTAVKIGRITTTSWSRGATRNESSPTSIGFVSAEKRGKLENAIDFGRAGTSRVLATKSSTAIEFIGDMAVYDIETESHAFLTNNVVVHNCFIQSVNDDLVNEGGIMDLGSVRPASLNSAADRFKFLCDSRRGREALRRRDVVRIDVVLEGRRSRGGGDQVGRHDAPRSEDGMLNLDHPDIEDFISWKVDRGAEGLRPRRGLDHVREASQRNHAGRERRVAAGKRAARSGAERALKAAIRAALGAGIPQANIQYALDFARQGYRELTIETYDTNWDSKAYVTVSGQNSNNSVRIPNEFFARLDAGQAWDLIRRTDGRVARSVPGARHLGEDRARCVAVRRSRRAIRHDDQRVAHLPASDGRINASNPCVTSDTLVSTSEGVMPVSELIGKPFEALVDGKPHASTERGFFFTGTKPVFALLAPDGTELLKATDNHLVRIVSDDGGEEWREVGRLRVGDRLAVHHNAEGGHPCVDLLSSRGLVRRMVRSAVAHHASIRIERGRSRRYVVLEDIVARGVEDVYDCTVPGVHAFDANGLYVHNCSEYVFLDDTACNLASR